MKYRKGIGISIKEEGIDFFMNKISPLIKLILYID